MNRSLPVQFPLIDIARPNSHLFLVRFVTGKKNVIVQEYDQTDGEGDHGELPKAEITEDVFVPSKELTDHPGAVGRDPQSDDQVMQQLRMDMPGLPGDENRHCQRGQDHDGAERFEIDRPTCVLNEPKENMHVLDPAETIGYGINPVFLHLRHGYV